MLMEVFFGKPDGCPCHPDFYRGFHTWALYEDGEFLCSGQRFNTRQEAFDAGTQWLNEYFPSTHLENNDQN